MPLDFRGLVVVAMETEETNLATSTASLLTALEAATSSSRFQIDSRFSRASFSLVSSSRNLTRHSSKSDWSASENIFLMLSVRLWTAWFQWLCIFLSKAGKIMGSITLRLSVIRFLMWSLFQRNNARSATCQNENNYLMRCKKCINHIRDTHRREQNPQGFELDLHDTLFKVILICLQEKGVTTNFPQQKLHKTHVIKRNSHKNEHVIIMTKTKINRVMTRTAIKQLRLLPHENIINPRGNQNPTNSKTKNTQSQHLGGKASHKNHTSNSPFPASMFVLWSQTISSSTSSQRKMKISTTYQSEYKYKKKG